MIRRAFLALAICTISIGCGHDEDPTSPTAENAPLYWSLDLNYHAILLSTVAPYDTVRLVVKPLGANRTPWGQNSYTPAELDSIYALNPPEFVSADSAVIKVSSDGVVRAVGVTGATRTVRIIVRQTIGNVTRADSALVRSLNVAQPQVLASFRVRPGDSLRVAVGATRPIALSALDSSSLPIPSVVTHIQSLDSVAISASGSRYIRRAWNSNSVFVYQRGKTKLISDAFVYGVFMADTVELTAIRNITNSFGVRKRAGVLEATLSDSIRVIGYGGTISFAGSVSDALEVGLYPFDIIFEDSINVYPAPNPTQNSGGGNIFGIQPAGPGQGNSGLRHRSFREPGRYPFVVYPYGLRGAVIVLSEND